MITILGLGYVGIPLMIRCLENGSKVYGVDIDNNKIESLKKGVSPIKEEGVEEKLKEIGSKVVFTTDIDRAIQNSETVIVCVPTPADCNHIPDLSFIETAAEQISKSLKKDQLVIIESTIYPGTTEEIIMPTLEKSGLKAGRDFYLAYCPERIDPGNEKWNVSNLPRVVGGVDGVSLDKAVEFYKQITSGSVTGLSSIKAAEATKIMENTFRDVNIAFVNEMAKSFDKAGIDINEVIRGAVSKPFGFMPHHPGCGVGGHCIPVDPYYLIEKAKEVGFDHKFLSLAREINNSMPNYAVELLEEEVEKLGERVEGVNIGVMGLAYKKDVDDIRESPALKIIEILKSKRANVLSFDPFIKEKSNVDDLRELFDKVEFVILATDHSEFTNMDLGLLKENRVKVIIDGRNCLDKKKVRSLGIAYRGIGVR